MGEGIAETECEMDCLRKERFISMLILTNIESIIGYKIITYI